MTEFPSDNIGSEDESVDDFDEYGARLKFSQTASDFIRHLEEDSGREVPDDLREELMKGLEDAFTDRAELAHREGYVAGELAAKDPQKALEYMGGEEKARELIGDEMTNELLEDIKKRKAEEN